MKLVGFLPSQQVRLGFLLEEEILDPGLACSSLAPDEGHLFRDATSFIRAGKPAFELASRLIEQRPRNALQPLAGAKLTAPMLPSTILCAGSNYREHNEEKAGAPMSGKEPEFFIKTSDSVVGPEEDIQSDEILTRKLDCEAELAIVIGTAGRPIMPDDWKSHVFGSSLVTSKAAIRGHSKTGQRDWPKT